MAFKVQIQVQPKSALDSLSKREAEQAAVSLHRLALGDFNSVPQVYKLKGKAGEADIHVMRINQRLRLLFTVDTKHEIVVVHDLINRDFVRRYG